MVRKMFLLTALALSLLVLSACMPGMLAPFTAQATVSQSFDVPTPRVSVETFNGSIDVTTGSGDTVQIEVTKRGSGVSQSAAEDDLKNVQVNFTQDGDSVRVVVTRPQPHIGNSGASVTIRLPEQAELDLRTSNGRITVGGAVNDVKARASNGPIVVRGSTGSLDLQTSNGPIETDGGRGRLTLETSNGPITIRSAEATVNARTSNGPIRFTGSLSEGEHVLRSSNANIVMTLPAAASFSVDASTSNGNISSDFTLASGEQTEKRMNGTVGTQPNAALDVQTSNGSIDLNKGN